MKYCNQSFTIPKTIHMFHQITGFAACTHCKPKKHPSMKTTFGVNHKADELLHSENRKLLKIVSLSTLTPVTPPETS